jgi:3alpha(or 20beta)-hydroxysteroid dehydrogenase
MNALTGKVAVVTGAGGGIGRATCRRLADEGMSVLATDLGAEPLAETVEVVEAAGGDIDSLVADASSASDWAATLDRAVARFGGVDALVNNAGIEGTVRPMAEYPEELFDRVLAVNVKGVWLGMRTFADALAERGGGAVVNVSSVAGLGGAPGLSAYVASKHAVIGLTRTAALELAPQGIRVNAVCPSPIETRMMRSLEEAIGGPEGMALVQAQMAARIPLGRYGTPDEVAATIAFLVGPDSVFLSGVALPVDGALTAN